MLIVLWSVVLLALLATAITAAGRGDVQLASNIRRAAAAEAAADGGIAAAIVHASDIPARAWLADGTLHVLPLGAYSLTIRIADESRKVNPNIAAPYLMTALLTASGADPAQAASLAEAMTQWRQAERREALSAGYRAAGLAAGPTGAPFRSLGEIGLVMGMTPALLARLAPHLSIFADVPINLTQADPVVQAALQTLGTPPSPSTTPPTVIEVTSDAQGPGGSRFIRRAVVSLGKDQSGRLYRTLQWEALVAPSP